MDKLWKPAVSSPECCFTLLLIPQKLVYSYLCMKQEPKHRYWNYTRLKKMKTKLRMSMGNCRSREETITFDHLKTRKDICVTVTHLETMCSRWWKPFLMRNTKSLKPISSEASLHRNILLILSIHSTFPRTFRGIWNSCVELELLLVLKSYLTIYDHKS